MTSHQTNQSQILFDRASLTSPGGVNSPVRAFRSVGGTPRFIKRAEGAYMWDEDDTRYIDYVGSWGPAIVGHAHPKVVQAVQDAAAQLAALRQAEWQEVTVQFADVRNLADRILTEFSPWQKRCSFDAEAGRYTLTLAYQQRDVWDITVRLMGYGAGIRFADPEHEIAREVARRVREQARLFGE